MSRINKKQFAHRVMRIFVGFTALILINLAGCHPQRPSSSEVNIDSGIYINPENKNHVSAVVNIKGCTATIVSTDTLLTAAHCTWTGEQICIISQPYKGICSDKVESDPKFIMKPYVDSNGRQRIQYGNWQADVAVAHFSGEPFKHIFTVFDGPSLQKDESVLMVGYSPQKPGPERTDSDKRWGKNTISQILDYSSEVGTIETEYNNSSNKVAVSPGDSGGPMFNASCQQIGVTSRMADFNSINTKRSLHTNLSNPEIRSWFDSLSKDNSMKATFCTTSMVGQNPKCPEDAIFKLATSDSPIAKDSNEFPCIAKNSLDPNITPNTDQQNQNQIGQNGSQNQQQQQNNNIGNNNNNNNSNNNIGNNNSNVVPPSVTTPSDLKYFIRAEGLTPNRYVIYVSADSSISTVGVCQNRDARNCLPGVGFNQAANKMPVGGRTVFKISQPVDISGGAKISLTIVGFTGNNFVAPAKSRVMEIGS